MSEKIGDIVERHAIAEFQTLTVTGKLSHRDDQRHTFRIGYMAGYLLAQNHFLEQIKKGKQ